MIEPIPEPKTLSEALRYRPGVIVTCDVCGEIIDEVTGGFWLDRIEKGLLYAGKLSCWRDNLKEKT